MRIGELARQVNLRTSTLRYYERIGLLPEPARDNGRRNYGEEALGLLRLIRSARRLGYSLEDLRPLIGAFRAGREPASVCQDLAERKSAELDQLIQRATEMKQALAAGLDCDCGDPEDCFLCHYE